MEHMNTGNEALDCWNEMEMRHDKYLMLGAKWNGWYVTPTAPLEPTMDGKKKNLCVYYSHHLYKILNLGCAKWFCEFIRQHLLSWYPFKED